MPGSPVLSVNCGGKGNRLIAGKSRARKPSRGPGDEWRYAFVLADSRAAAKRSGSLVDRYT